jgi:hypothetical protein
MSLNASQPHTTKTDSRGSRRTLRDTNRRPSTRRLYDGVVASYLHDISGHRRRSARGSHDGDVGPRATAVSRVAARSVPQKDGTRRATTV